MIKVAPSLLAADLLRLGEELESVLASGLTYVHIDVMDGRYVPNISYGPNMAYAIKRFGDLKYDCHLMVEEPENHVEAFAQAGAEYITVHAEKARHLHRLIYRIKELRSRAGVALNPGTPLEWIMPVLPDVDLVLVMSVNPGFGGQKFIPASYGRIEQLAHLRREMGLEFDIQVDGGINIETGQACVKRGADFLVAGAAFFGADDRLRFARSLAGEQ